MLIQLEASRILKTRSGVVKQLHQDGQNPLILKPTGADVFQFSGVRFASDDTPVPADLTSFQSTKLFSLLPPSVSKNLERSLRPYRKNWVRLKLEVGKPPVVVYKEGNQLKEAPFQGPSKGLKANELWGIHTRLEKDLDGPDSKAHQAKLRSVLELVDMPAIEQAMKAEELERKKIKGDMATYLVSLFPFKFQSGLHHYLEKGQNGVIQKIRVSHNSPIQVRLEGAGGLNDLKTPKFTPADVAEFRQNVANAQALLDREKGRKEADEVNVKAPLKKLLPLIDIERLPETAQVKHEPQASAAEHASLEESDWPILEELLPGKLSAVLDQVPVALRPYIHGIKIGVNQPVQIVRDTQVIATGTTPLSLDDVNGIEQSLEGLQNRSKKSESDDPLTYRRAYVRLKALTHFDWHVPVEHKGTPFVAVPNLKERNQEDFNKLLSILPSRLKAALQTLDSQYPGQIEDIKLHKGLVPKIFVNNERILLNQLEPVTDDEIKSILASQTLSKLGPKGRCGINGTLHRVSPVQNRDKELIGVTLRVGRVHDVDISPIRKLLDNDSSILILGPAGVGKTTLLRKIARYLAEANRSRDVIVVDTSNEIGGDGDVPHWFLGNAERLQVPSQEEQHLLMTQALQNHRAGVEVIDEIAWSDEARAALELVNSGVTLIATGHGDSLQKFLSRKEMAFVAGEPMPQTVSDETAKLGGGFQKSVTETTTDPVFDALLVLTGRNRGELYEDFRKAINAQLRGKPLKPALIQFNKV